MLLCKIYAEMIQIFLLVPSVPISHVRIWMMTRDGGGPQGAYCIFRVTVE